MVGLARLVEHDVLTSMDIRRRGEQAAKRFEGFRSKSHGCEWAYSSI